jgi:transposase
LERLPAGASRVRGELLHDQLEELRRLRRKAKRELLGESRKHMVAARLREIPGLGPLRVALLIAAMQTPHRFRTRRQLWAYAGLGLIQKGSSEFRLVEGLPVRRARALQPRAQQGVNPAILRVTVARKLAALTLSLWKKGGRYRAEGVKQA